MNSFESHLRKSIGVAVGLSAVKGFYNREINVFYTRYGNAFLDNFCRCMYCGQMFSTQRSS